MIKLLSKNGNFLVLLLQIYNKFSVSPVKPANENIIPLNIEDFDYNLPDERIAKYPLPQRDASKLLIYKNDAITESTFSHLVEFLPSNSLLVYNNTKVIEARLIFYRETGARIEIFCLKPVVPSDYALSLGSFSECVWKCMIGNQKKWKGEVLIKEVNIDNKNFLFQAELLEKKGNVSYIRFFWDAPDVSFAEILEKAGELPIPPYLHRKTEKIDLTAYQTVYAKMKGSVASPTAGLHFTPEVFESLKTKNIETTELTLHVGAGTFQPVKTQNVLEHEMHTEVFMVSKNTIEQLLDKLGNIIAVGTTSARTLESLYYIGLLLSQDSSLKEKPTSFFLSQWLPYTMKNEISTKTALTLILEYLEKNKLSHLYAQTQIMIQPAYTFHLINGLITNFHQPKSTLLLLISAFVGDDWRKIYHYALEHNFRFLSYGDSSLLLK